MRNTVDTYHQEYQLVTVSVNIRKDELELKLLLLMLHVRKKNLQCVCVFEADHNDMNSRCVDRIWQFI